MNQTNPKEATISTSDFTLQVKEWIETVDPDEYSLGASVAESLARAVELRRQGDACAFFEFEDPSETPDLVHALCRILMEECTVSPNFVLRDAKAFHDALERRRWEFDELSEREGLLCSLALICWRASRLLNLSREAQRWWSDYRKHLHSSIDWDASGEEWGSLSPWRRFLPDGLEAGGFESVLRILLHLQERLESDPHSVAIKALAIYQCLSECLPFAPDLHSFFEGEAARLLSSALRVTGRYQDASHWLDIAESHVRSGLDPDPQLARILYARLTISYGLSQFETVLSIAPILDQKFGSLGMEEERVKCGVLWGASLKVTGQPEAALEVLENLRRSTSAINTQLSGWVLAEIGDIQGICGDHELGLRTLQIAAQLLRQEGQFTELANVNSIIGCMCRSRGLLVEAARLFTEAISDFERLGMASNAAYTRLLVAETYLAMYRPRDAERAVLDALPFIEREGVSTDSVVALSIYREAVRRQRLDPQMLRELRERLRPGGQ